MSLQYFVLVAKFKQDHKSMNAFTCLHDHQAPTKVLNGQLPAAAREEITAMWPFSTFVGHTICTRRGGPKRRSSPGVHIPTHSQ